MTPQSAHAMGPLVVAFQKHARHEPAAGGCLMGLLGRSSTGSSLRMPREGWLAALADLRVLDGAIGPSDVEQAASVYASFTRPRRGKAQAMSWDAFLKGLARLAQSRGCTLSELLSKSCDPTCHSTKSSDSPSKHKSLHDLGSRVLPLLQHVSPLSSVNGGLYGSLAGRDTCTATHAETSATCISSSLGANGLTAYLGPSTSSLLPSLPLTRGGAAASVVPSAAGAPARVQAEGHDQDGAAGAAAGAGAGQDSATSLRGRPSARSEPAEGEGLEGFISLPLSKAPPCTPDTSHHGSHHGSRQASSHNSPSNTEGLFARTSIKALQQMHEEHRQAHVARMVSGQEAPHGESQNAGTTMPLLVVVEEEEGAASSPSITAAARHSIEKQRQQQQGQASSSSSYSSARSGAHATEARSTSESSEGASSADAGRAAVSGTLQPGSTEGPVPRSRSPSLCHGLTQMQYRKSIEEAAVFLGPDPFLDHMPRLKAACSTGQLQQVQDPLDAGIPRVSSLPTMHEHAHSMPEAQRPPVASFDTSVLPYQHQYEQVLSSMGSLQEQVSAVARALADSVVPASQAHQQALQSLAGLEWRLAALERCMSQWMQRKPQGAAVPSYAGRSVSHLELRVSHLEDMIAAMAMSSSHHARSMGAMHSSEHGFFMASPSARSSSTMHGGGAMPHFHSQGAHGPSPAAHPRHEQMMPAQAASLAAAAMIGGGDMAIEVPPPGARPMGVTIAASPPAHPTPSAGPPSCESGSTNGSSSSFRPASLKALAVAIHPEGSSAPAESATSPAASPLGSRSSGTTPLGRSPMAGAMGCVLELSSRECSPAHMHEARGEGRSAGSGEGGMGIGAWSPAATLTVGSGASDRLQLDCAPAPAASEDLPAAHAAGDGAPSGPGPGQEGDPGNSRAPRAQAVLWGSGPAARGRMASPGPQQRAQYPWEKELDSMLLEAADDVLKNDIANGVHLLKPRAARHHGPMLGLHEPPTRSLDSRFDVDGSAASMPQTAGHARILSHSMSSGTVYGSSGFSGGLQEQEQLQTGQVPRPQGHMGMPLPAHLLLQQDQPRMSRGSDGGGGGGELGMALDQGVPQVQLTRHAASLLPQMAASFSLAHASTAAAAGSGCMGHPGLAQHMGMGVSISMAGSPARPSGMNARSRARSVGSSPVMPSTLQRRRRSQPSSLARSLFTSKMPPPEFWDADERDGATNLLPIVGSPPDAPQPPMPSRAGEGQGAMSVSGLAAGHRLAHAGLSPIPSSSIIRELVDAASAAEEMENFGDSLGSGLKEEVPGVQVVCSVRGAPQGSTPSAGGGGEHSGGRRMGESAHGANAHGGGKGSPREAAAAAAASALQHISW